MQTSSPLPLIFLTFIPSALCQSSAHEIPIWQKVCVIVGILLTIVSIIVYILGRNNINLHQTLHLYIAPSQAETTFVEYKNNNSQAETVIDTSNNISDRGSSFEDYAKEDELSVDHGDDNGENSRDLADVFREKQGQKAKKSKSRKRLANNAKVIAENKGNQEQNTPIDEEDVI